MQITGTVVKVLPLVTGTSAKGEWKKQSVIIEFKDGDYKNHLELSAMKDKATSLGELKEGQEVCFDFNVTSREHNGKWFTQASPWKWNVVGGSASNSTTEDAAF